MYKKKYLEAKNSYDEGFVEDALEEFKSFLEQNNHATNSVEVSNTHRYIAKLYYEKGEYSESLNTWCLKKTRSAFTWKDFYSRALSAIFYSYHSIRNGNYILIEKDAIHYEYNVLDILLDLEITQNLLRDKISDKRPWSNQFQRYLRLGDDPGLKWFTEVLLNSQYYKCVTLNLLLQLKLLYNIDSFLIQKDKHKIYNKSLSKIIKNEHEILVENFNDGCRLFEHSMCELSQFEPRYNHAWRQYYGLGKVSNPRLYTEEFNEEFDLIPYDYSLIQRKLLADKLLYLLEILDIESRERQIDLWDAELGQDVLIYLNNLSNKDLKRIKKSLMKNLGNEDSWDRDWSAFSFLPQHHQYRDWKEYDGCRYFFWDQLYP